jgi:beta-lactamase regulating signal transducer with metallopeptidase domain
MSLHAVTLPALASAQPTMFGLRSNAGSAIPNSATGLAGHAAIAISHAVTLLATRASTALVAAIWEGFVLAACVALCLRLLPRIGAAARSLIWSAVLLLVLALPMLSLLPGVAHSVALGHAASSAAATTLHSLPLDDRWAFALAALWVCASLIRAVRLVRGAYRLRQIAQRATPVEVSPACATLLAEAPHRRLQGRPVQLCSSTDIDRPSVAGFFSPRILLPPSLLARLSATELEPILRHELEHLRRSDDWTNLLQKLALVLFPLNPVLLWVERRLCLERELACDDGVLRATRAPKAYATSLATLAEHALVRRGISLALAAWDRQSELARRVHRILGRSP